MKMNLRNRWQMQLTTQHLMLWLVHSWVSYALNTAQGDSQGCCVYNPQEWEAPQPSKRPDIFPEFEKPERVFLPKPLPGNRAPLDSAFAPAVCLCSCHPSSHTLVVCAICIVCAVRWTCVVPNARASCRLLFMPGRSCGLE